LFKVLSCLTVEHDLRLVALAAVVCALGSWIAIRLFLRARGDTGVARAQWLFLAGLAAGSATWATHFLAMLAFEPGLPTGYVASETVASLFVAIGALAAGFTVAAFARPVFMAEVGGGILGLGISAMHYIGMAGFRTAGEITWDPVLVTASVVLSVLFGALALHLAVQPRTSLWHRYGAALALILAICTLHFTAMGAVTIIPDPTVAVPASALPNHIMALCVTIVSAMVIGTGFAAYFLDAKGKADGEARLRTLADAAIEGIVIARDGKIEDVNTSFERLTGRNRDSLLGKALFPNLLTIGDGGEPADMRGAEGKLRTCDGRHVPVEVLVKPEGAQSARRIYSVRDLSEKKADEGRIHYLAHFDPLSGLPNRTSFMDRLDGEIAAAEARHERFALLSFDLDRFKEVNDIFGHAAGDAALVEIAQRLSALRKPREFLARLGGDEFVAILSSVDRPEEMIAFAERILGAVCAPLGVADNELHLGASLGISIYPDDATTAADLLANSDLAMYRAKQTVGNKVCFFEATMDRKVRERRALANDLRRALGQHELELYYQVQSRISDGQPVGFEALLRWNHPQRGLVSPAEFIPIAEETGTILPIGNWVIRTACATAAKWSEPWRIAVNLSPVQFVNGNLPEVVHSILLETGLAPARLELEITESVLIGDFDRVLRILRRLKALGIKIAMDDFGTGYSSLSTLQAFPFDKIKIDRSFIENLDKQHQSASIVRAILALGRSLNVPVLAEGIETQAHLDFLRQEGCDEAQGYLLGRPARAESMFAQESRSHAAMAMATGSA